jgi:hypothetical protein
MFVFLQTARAARAIFLLRLEAFLVTQNGRDPGSVTVRFEHPNPQSRRLATRWRSKGVGRAAIMPSNQEVRRAVEDAVETEIQRCDFDQVLRNKDYEAILVAVADEVFHNRLLAEMRPELTESDYTYIESKVEPMVQECLAKPYKTRFERFERVVCKIGGQYGWGPGTIQALDEADPQDPSGQRRLPYVVKLDPPIGRLISVPYDETSICRPEVCFGKMSMGDLGFTLRCKPRRQLKSEKRRFALGERVACAVEDASGDYTVWAAGTVSDVEYNVEPDATELSLQWDWSAGAGMIPYRVLLDASDGAQPQHVYVHRDEHWLVRDLKLQPAGPRQAEDGTRELKRLVKRRCDAGWELIDHATRKVRHEAAGGTDDEDSDDDEMQISVS